MKDKPKIGINCMIHNPCQTCQERPARFIFKNKLNGNKLKVCKECKEEVFQK